MIGTGTGNGFAIGKATGTGKMIGDFFKFLRMAAPLAILAILIAFNAFTAPTFNATVFFATLNGAVIRLRPAIFAALACKYTKKINSNQY